MNKQNEIKLKIELDIKKKEEKYKDSTRDYQSKAFDNSYSAN